MRVFLPPVRRPRHPVMRVLMGLLGLAVLGVFMVFGLMALAVFIAVGGVLFLLRWWNTRKQRGTGRAGTSRRYAGEQVIEGEYVIVHESRHSTHH